jgi:hypothetical protein
MPACVSFSLHSSRDCRWLATADCGPDSTLIVWDTKAAAPVRTYFSQQVGAGCIAIDISADAMYLTTLSASSPQVWLLRVSVPHVDTQTVSVWDWTAPDRETPLLSVVLEGVSSFMVRVRAYGIADSLVLHQNAPRESKADCCQRRQ